MNPSYPRCLKGRSVTLSDDPIDTDCLSNKSKFDLKVSKASRSLARGASRIIKGIEPELPRSAAGTKQPRVEVGWGWAAPVL